jgi:hypothetical protein
MTQYASAYVGPTPLDKLIPVLTKYKYAPIGKKSNTPPSWLENFESEKSVDTAIENEILAKANKMRTGKMRKEFSGMKIGLM